MQLTQYVRLFVILTVTTAVLALVAFGPALAAPRTGAQAGVSAQHSSVITAPNNDGTPEATEPPEATQPPEATHPPEGSRTPEATEPPERTHTPEATEPPEATETEAPKPTLPPPVGTGTVPPKPAGTAPAAVVPGTSSQDFPETHQTVRGLFLSYWQQHGTLPQQGFPISGAMREVSALDGKTYTVQYFERAVFELHPENVGTPYEVLLAQLGTYRYQARYGAAGAPGQQASSVNPRFFPETGKTLAGRFRAYWESHGGLAQQGYPISNEFTEASALDPGKSYTVQYFERAVFEYHPENAGTPYEVLLAQLGTYRYQALHNGR